MIQNVDDVSQDDSITLYMAQSEYENNVNHVLRLSQSPDLDSAERVCGGHVRQSFPPPPSQQRGNVFGRSSAHPSCRVRGLERPVKLFWWNSLYVDILSFVIPGIYTYLRLSKVQ